MTQSEFEIAIGQSIGSVGKSGRFAFVHSIVHCPAIHILLLSSYIVAYIYSISSLCCNLPKSYGSRKPPSSIRPGNESSFLPNYGLWTNSSPSPSILQHYDTLISTQQAALRSSKRSTHKFRQFSFKSILKSLEASDRLFQALKEQTYILSICQLHLPRVHRWYSREIDLDPCLGRLALLALKYERPWLARPIYHRFPGLSSTFNTLRVQETTSNFKRV